MKITEKQFEEAIERYALSNILPGLPEKSMSRAALYGAIFMRHQLLESKGVYSIARQYGFMDDDGIDIDALRDFAKYSLSDDLKVDVPIIDKSLTFRPGDVDTLYSLCVGG